mmetsp:Transcript_66872/g.145843  ORF Transcript_66872/g.145843 Transcript_66872/m.145843 type:complete len:204 (+) Transcript_66872:762-1373(+)
MLCQLLGSLHQRGADGCDEQHKDDLEVEVPVLNPMLHPSLRLKHEEVAEDKHEESGYETNEELEGQGRNQAIPERSYARRVCQCLECWHIGLKILKTREVGDPKNARHVGPENSSDEAVPNEVPHPLRTRIPLQVGVDDVSWVWGNFDGELVCIRCECHHFGQLCIAAVLEGHKAAGEVRATNICRLLPDPQPRCLHVSLCQC